MTVTDNDSPDNWCKATQTYGTVGQKGSPRLPNDTTCQ
jgi:hypothetical protein